MERRRVLMINLGWEQEPLLSAIIGRGCEVYGIHNGPPPAGFPLAGFRSLDFRDLGGILEYARQVQPHAVISDQCDYSMFAQAVVADALGLPGPSVRDAQVATNKLIQREACKAKGVLIPAFAAVTCVDEAVDAAKKIGFPVILKPVDNRGSFGVGRADCESEIAQRFSEALINSHSRTVIVERFIEGVHITVDGYAFPRNGVRSLACASKTLLGDGRQVAMDIIYPAELSGRIRDNAMRVSEAVNSALGFSFGMLHSEYMVTDCGEVYLIETANRGGGCFTSEVIVPKHSGIDLINQLIDDALGIRNDRYEPPSESGVLLKFFRFAQGRVSSVSGIDNAKSSPEVLAIRLAISEGSEIKDITTDGNRHGFLILAGGSELRSTAEEIMSRIEVRYE